jgi:hypothetical protein
VTHFLQEFPVPIHEKTFSRYLKLCRPLLVRSSHSIPTKCIVSPKLHLFVHPRPSPTTPALASQISPPLSSAHQNRTILPKHYRAPHLIPVHHLFPSLLLSLTPHTIKFSSSHWPAFRFSPRSQERMRLARDGNIRCTITICSFSPERE